MCLIVSVPEVFIAETDITCYKIYAVKDGKLVSPYRGAPIPEFNILNTTKLGDAILYYDLFKINEGFHSYLNLFDADPRHFIWSALSDEAIVVRCIIPKGSKFYKGMSNKHESYCSESIILKEIMYTVKRNINLEEK